MSAARVCILTAGKGSRLNERTKFFNKCLLKVQDVAIITHQIRMFPPDSTFVIGLGYMGDVVREYLEIAHPTTKFIFVDIDKYSVPGSGPGYALLKCKEHLQQPFYFIACDTLVGNWDYHTSNLNWVGCAEVAHGTQQNYCILDIMECDCCIDQFIDKSSECNERQTLAFIGFAHIAQYKKFWNVLEHNTALVAGELQLSPALNALAMDTSALHMRWFDVGTEDGLLAARDHYGGRLNLDKSDEEIYFVDDKVIKYFYDADIAQKRIQRTEILNRWGDYFVPLLIDKRNHFYSYKFVEGKDLFSIPDPCQHFFRLMHHMHSRFWTRETLANGHQFVDKCIKFYRHKTHARVLQFIKDHDADHECIINNVATPSALQLMSWVDWQGLAALSVPSRIHGDFQLSNVVMDSNGDFTLIDWRQDFAGDMEVGDLYYDLAKLNACFVMPHDSVKAGRYTFKESKGEVLVDIEQSEEIKHCQSILKQWHIANDFDWDRTVFITYLALLNMAPLHESPLDKWLHYTARRGLAAHGHKFFLTGQPDA